MDMSFIFMFQNSSKPVIYMETLLHAREWITQSATLYAIEKLIIDVEDSDLVNDIDWIIVPIANPDGYEFSHDGVSKHNLNVADF